MKNKILADTSVWVEFFRPNTETGDKLESLISKNSVQTCGVVLFELLQGIKSDSEKSRILSAFSGLPYIEMSSDLWKESASLVLALKKTGFTLPLSDILIAAIALRYDLSLFTLDRHFRDIPGLRIYE